MGYQRKHLMLKQPGLSKPRKEDSLANAIYSSNWMREKAQDRKSYAQNLYAAMCNRVFVRLDVVSILKDQCWHISWRGAGGVVATLIGEGDYMDWYCSGIQGGDFPEAYMQPFTNGYVDEGVVTDEIREDLKKLGWIVLDEEEKKIK